MKNLLVDLDDARFSQRAVHRTLEDLDRRGLRPLREHRTPERFLSWIDCEFGGAWSSEAAAGGIWIAEAGARPVAFAAYDARGLRYYWLREWSQKQAVGIVGPCGVEPPLRRTGLGTALLHAALFSLRERGYRQALVPAVATPECLAFYEAACGARAVENVDSGRKGRRYRATVLASGNGSNFQAVLDAAAAGTVPLDVVALVANKPEVYAIERAERAGVPVRVVAWDRGAEPRDVYDARVIEAVAETKPELVLLLGWMHVLPASFVARFPQALNLHPAFLPLDPGADTVTMPDGAVMPALRGAHALDDALATKAAWAGATVHRVGVAVDRGEVLARAPLPLDATEARAALDLRLHALERTVLMAAIRRWSFEQP